MNSKYQEPITRKEYFLAKAAGMDAKTLEPITREEMFLSKISSGASSWNDLKDKPFGEETVTVNEPLNITWDGNTEGLVSDSSGIYYKVSNLVLSDEQIKLTKLTMSTGDSLSISEFWDGLVEGGAVTEDYVFLEYAILIRNDRVEMMGRVFTESGIYFGAKASYVSSLTTTEPIEQTKTVIKKIDEKYLPKVGGATMFTAVQQDDDTSRVLLSATLAEIYAATISNPSTVIELTPSASVEERYGSYKAYLRAECVDTPLQQIAFDGYITMVDSQNRRKRHHFVVYIEKTVTDTLGWLDMYKETVSNTTAQS